MKWENIAEEVFDWFDIVKGRNGFWDNQELKLLVQADATGDNNPITWLEYYIWFPLHYILHATHPHTIHVAQSPDMSLPSTYVTKIYNRNKSVTMCVTIFYIQYNLVTTVKNVMCFPSLHDNFITNHTMFTHVYQ